MSADIAAPAREFLIKEDFPIVSTGANRKNRTGHALPASHGETVKLSQFRGRKVVVFFYPKDQTPTCTQEACDFRDAHHAFEQADTVLIGISPDPVKSHVKFIQKQGLLFLLLSDEALTAAQAFDVWQEKQLYGRKYMGIVRSTFLIDNKGKLVREWRNVRLKGHIDEVLAAARSVDAGKGAKL